MSLPYNYDRRDPSQYHVVYSGSYNHTAHEVSCLIVSTTTGRNVTHCLIRTRYVQYHFKQFYFTTRIYLTTRR